MEKLEKEGLPSIMAADGPHGLRKTHLESDHMGVTQSLPSTCFPTSATTACSWDPTLLREIGEAIARECKKEKVSILLGPGMNIKRSPLCGRNFEYFSEDPYLTGSLATGYIQGVQSQGVGAAMKHFAANNREGYRLVSNSIVDRRALFEIYLSGFEMAVREADPWVVMAAYNKINGVYCCENSFLLTDILRTRWGFSGVVISDWGAVDNRIRALAAGLDVEMPSSFGERDRRILRGIKKERLSIQTLDEAARRIVSLILKAKPLLEQSDDEVVDVQEHHKLARKAAQESFVLMKNLENLLPLDPKEPMVVIGDMAKNPRYQGLGSSMLHPMFLENALDEMEKQGWDVTFAQGYQNHTDEEDDDLIAEACALAQAARTAVIFAGLPERYEAENVDRTHMKLPRSHNRLIEEVAKVQPHTVVVLFGGAPVEMPWIHQVQAVINGYLGGQAGASAMLDVLCGKVNPSGKLAETYPIQLEDNPAHRYFVCNDPKIVQYRESIFVGYRYYDSAKKHVLFPFGHGLSYTEFVYEDLRLSRETMDDRQTLQVTLTLRNIGSKFGKEVVQLYVRDETSTVFRPEKELKGFQKVAMEPGASMEVTFLLDARSFAYYNTNINDWHVETGAFTIQVGASSRDIRLEDKVWVESTQPLVTIPDHRSDAGMYYELKDEPFVVEDSVFQAVYGSPVATTQKNPPGEFTINSTLLDMQHTWVGKGILWKLKKESERMTDGPLSEGLQTAFDAMLVESPLRGLHLAAKGDVSLLTIHGLVQLANKEYGEGLRTLILAANLRRKP
jgi:beta-glucosidase